MPKIKKPKKEYEEYLNELSPFYESEEWIMRGKRRNYYARKRKYGTAMRKYDPLEFEVGYLEWRMK